MNGSIPCVGAAVNSGLDAVAQTTAQLQTPAAYAGIYARWNRDVDGDAFPDYPWNFGTTGQYPVLNTPAQRQTAAAVVMDYDQDNDNLIEIASLRQLDALRQDYDGDGRPQSAAAYPAYVGAFPNGNIADTSSPYMGCAAICIGYELAQSLDFDTSGDGRVTAADDYPDWQPIAAYAAALEGNGNTITRLTISGAAGNAGLFDTLTANAAVRNLGIIDAAITSGGANAKAGILAADNGGRIAASLRPKRRRNRHRGIGGGRRAGRAELRQHPRRLGHGVRNRRGRRRRQHRRAGRAAHRQHHRGLRRRPGNRRGRSRGRRAGGRRRRRQCRHHLRLLRHPNHDAEQLHRRPDQQCRRRRRGPNRRRTPSPHRLRWHLPALEHRSERRRNPRRPLEFRHIRPIPDLESPRPAPAVGHPAVPAAARPGPNPGADSDSDPDSGSEPAPATAEPPATAAQARR